MANKWEEQNAHRDLILSGLFRFGSIRHGPEFVGGFSDVYEDTLQQSALKELSYGRFLSVRKISSFH
jgi:hypothetical protein